MTEQSLCWATKKGRQKF